MSNTVTVCPFKYSTVAVSLPKVTNPFVLVKAWSQNLSSGFVIESKAIQGLVKDKFAGAVDPYR